MKCPCTSGADYAACCEPIVTSQQAATTAEQLMRSRYSAYSLGNVDWIVESQSPEGRQYVDRKATEDWSKRSTWHRLDVINVEQGTASDTEGLVEFKAVYTMAGEDITHHEIASFRKEDGTWYFGFVLVSVLKRLPHAAKLISANILTQ